MRKSNKGISLIVLVITIIVVIILAAAVILAMTNNNPIEQAKKARFLNDMSEIKSAIGLQIADKFTNNNEYKIEEFDESDITKILDKTDEYKAKLEVQNGILVDVNLNEPEKTWFKELGIGGSGSVTPPEKPNTDIEKPVDGILYKDSENNYAPIPNGFVVSTATGENTVNGGLVIKEGNDGSVTNANEFVWIPVPDITEMYDEATKRGKLYDFSANRVSTMRSDCLTTTDGYREPDVVSSYDSTSNDPIKITKVMLQTEFNAMIDSVKKYKGFYIGRYETGGLSKGTVVIKKGNADIVSQTWYTMYGKSKAMISNSYVQTGMIWGSQWDATLRYMNKYADTGNYVTNSTGKGNYSGNIIATGSNEAYNVKNIYDMAGNVYDWTMEAYSRNRRGIHGGGYSGTGSKYPASNRDNYEPTISYNYGVSRISLYLK